MFVHNLEEGLGLPASLPAVREAVAAARSRSLSLPSEPQYVLALVIVTALVFALAAWARRSSIGAYLLLVVQVTMGVNAVTHTVGALVLGRYVPGLVTAWLVQVPLALIVVLRAWHGSWLSGRQWGLAGLLALLLHGPVLLAILFAARLVLP